MAQTQSKTTSSKTSEKTNTEASVDDLYAMIDILKSDMQALTKTMSDVGKVEGHKAVEVTKERARDVRQAGEEQIDALRSSAEDYGREAGRYVREQPATALGIAAGLGLVVGILLSNRR